MGNKHLNVLTDVTCYDAHEKAGINCERRSCPNWIDHSVSNNCVMVATQHGKHTLQTIGQIYGLTRMRICQIEKEIIDKIKNVS